MGSDFQTYVEETAEFQTEVLISRIGSLVLFFTFFLSILLISAKIPFSIGMGISMLIILMIIGATILRFVLWTFSVLRSLWKVFRPPYSEDDFYYFIPEGELYLHGPERSAIRLPVGITLLSSFVWAGIHQLILMNLDSLLGIARFLVGLLPEKGIQLGLSLLSVLTGIQLADLLTGDMGVKSVIQMLLYIPSIVLSLLSVWIMIYYLEDRVLGNSSNNHTSHDLLDGPLLLNPRSEFSIAKWWVISIGTGIDRGIGEMKWGLIKSIFAPIFLFYLLVIVLSVI